MWFLTRIYNICIGHLWGQLELVFDTFQPIPLSSLDLSAKTAELWPNLSALHGSSFGFYGFDTVNISN